jgi:polyisoprenoid-binding protein YceI
MATFAIDPAHTDVQFSAKHMMVTTVRGTFADVRGTFELDEDEPTASRGEIRIQAASLDTGFGARDQHLRSPDFFDVDSHPEIVAVVTGIRHVRGDEYVVTADVTIRGTTRPVDLEARFLGFYPSMDGARRAGISLTTKIDRKDWGLDWNVALEAGGWLVGTDVKLEVDVALEEVAEAREAADAA